MKRCITKKKFVRYTIYALLIQVILSIFWISPASAGRSFARQATRSLSPQPKSAQDITRDLMRRIQSRNTYNQQKRELKYWVSSHKDFTIRRDGSSNYEIYQEAMENLADRLRPIEKDLPKRIVTWRKRNKNYTIRNKALKYQRYYNQGAAKKRDLQFKRPVGQQFMQVRGFSKKSRKGAKLDIALGGSAGGAEAKAKGGLESVSETTYRYGTPEPSRRSAPASPSSSPKERPPGSSKGSPPKPSKDSSAWSRTQSTPASSERSPLLKRSASKKHTSIDATTPWAP